MGDHAHEDDGDIAPMPVTAAGHQHLLSALGSLRGQKEPKAPDCMKPYQKKMRWLVREHNPLIDARDILHKGIKYFNECGGIYVEPDEPDEEDIDEKDEQLTELVQHGNAEEIERRRLELHLEARKDRDAITAYEKFTVSFPTFHTGLLVRLLDDDELFDVYVKILQETTSGARTYNIRKFRTGVIEILQDIRGGDRPFNPPIKSTGSMLQRGIKHPDLAMYLVPIEHHANMLQNAADTHRRMIDPDALDAISISPHDFSALLYKNPEAVDINKPHGRLLGLFQSDVFVSALRLHFQGATSFARVAPGSNPNVRRGAAQLNGMRSLTERGVATVWVLLFHSISDIGDWRHVPEAEYLARFFSVYDLLREIPGDPTSDRTGIILRAISARMFSEDDAAQAAERLKPRPDRGAGAIGSVRQRIAAVTARLAAESQPRHQSDSLGIQGSTAPSRSSSPALSVHHDSHPSWSHGSPLTSPSVHNPRVASTSHSFAPHDPPVHAHHPPRMPQHPQSPYVSQNHLYNHSHDHSSMYHPPVYHHPSPAGAPAHDYHVSSSSQPSMYPPLHAHHPHHHPAYTDSHQFQQYLPHSPPHHPRSPPPSSVSHHSAPDSRREPNTWNLPPVGAAKRPLHPIQPTQPDLAIHDVLETPITPTKQNPAPMTITSVSQTPTDTKQSVPTAVDDTPDSPPIKKQRSNNSKAKAVKAPSSGFESAPPVPSRTQPSIPGKTRTSRNARATTPPRSPRRSIRQQGKQNKPSPANATIGNGL